MGGEGIDLAYGQRGRGREQRMGGEGIVLGVAPSLWVARAKGGEGEGT
jgi:hypothetical protein